MITRDKVAAALGSPYVGWLGEEYTLVAPLSEAGLDMLPVAGAFETGSVGNA